MSITSVLQQFTPQLQHQNAFANAYHLHAERNYRRSAPAHANCPSYIFTDIGNRNTEYRYMRHRAAAGSNIEASCQVHHNPSLNFMNFNMEKIILITCQRQNKRTPTCAAQSRLICAQATELTPMPLLDMQTHFLN